MPKPSADTVAAKKDELAFGVLPGLVGYHIRVAQIALFRDFAETMAEFDVTPGLFGILVVIEANPDLKQSELARATHLDRSTVVSVIDKLEQRKLVERRAALNDRRSNALRLTGDGAALLRKLKQRVSAHEQRLTKHLSPAERETLVSLLQKIFPEHR